MSTIGVLIDVSGSMKSAFAVLDSHLDQRVKRIHSTITAIASIVKERVAQRKQEEEMFVGVFGLQETEKTCDLLTLLLVQDLYSNIGYFYDGYEAIAHLAEEHNREHVVPWIKEHLTETQSRILYNVLRQDREKQDNLISLIPSKDSWSTSVANASYLPDESSRTGKVLSYVPGVNDLREKSKNTVKNSQALAEAKSMISDSIYQEPVLRSVQEVSKILDDKLQQSITSGRSATIRHDTIKQVIASIEPYIYGRTPMCGALNEAKGIFDPNSTQGWASTIDSIEDTFGGGIITGFMRGAWEIFVGQPNRQQKSRSLFLLSDGQATDGNPVPIAERMHSFGVTIVTCYLTSDAIPNPKCLFDPNWKFDDEGRQALFAMSSTMRNTQQPLSCLTDMGWELPQSGESRLFIQANSLDVVNEFSKIVFAHAND